MTTLSDVSTMIIKETVITIAGSDTKELVLEFDSDGDLLIEVSEQRSGERADIVLTAKEVLKLIEWLHNSVSA